MGSDQLFELRRRRFDSPEFRDVEFIEVETKSALNHVPGSGVPFDWTINPYRGCTHACTYCFARVTHTYLGMDAGRDFERRIVVKVNVAEVLDRELAAPRWKGEAVAMGTATDPYQRCEGRYRLMPKIIRALSSRRNPFSILTKSPLILRDLPLLQEAAEHADVRAAFSIGTLDQDVWRRTEPGTPSPRKRLEAISRLHDAGIPTGVLMAPILPGISDGTAQLREVAAAAIEAGAEYVSPILLHLRPGVREEFMPWLEREYPDLVPRYGSLYRTPYGPTGVRRELSERVDALAREAGGRPRPHRRYKHRSSNEAPSREEQLRLF